MKLGIVFAFVAFASIHTSASCIDQSVLQCINDASGFWPACSPTQAKNIVGPDGYEFGHYCTQDWTNAFNEMMSLPEVNKCDDKDTIHKVLAQIAYETGYFSTVFQPRDGGAGLIHMIPQNWRVNAADMDDLWPGNDYTQQAQQLGKSFFQDPRYGWRSVAAWFLETNSVIPGCSGNLFEKSYDEMTRCIFSQVIDRSESFNIVANCMADVVPVSPVTPVDPVVTSSTDSWCGITWEHADSTCGTACPNGVDSECPSGEFCFADVSCSGSNPAPADNPNPSTTGNWCGMTWEQAGLTCGTACPNGMDNECPLAESCFADVSCSGSNPAPADDPNPSTTGNWCGISWEHAGSTCGTACPNGVDSECPSGEFCFAGVACTQFTDTNPVVPFSDPVIDPPAGEVSNCIDHSVMVCINNKSTFWPKCDPRQSKSVSGPDGYEFGHYCTEDWVNAFNAMMSSPEVDKCDDKHTIHKTLAQIAYETGYFSTVFQPRDGGAGLIHMIPQNWEVNAQDMDDLWPGSNYKATAQSMGKNFFQSSQYGWKSVAAWFLQTNEVIPGCDINLFEATYDEMTRCILSRVNDRSEAFRLVGECMGEVATLPPIVSPCVQNTDCSTNAHCNNPGFDVFCADNLRINGVCPDVFCVLQDEIVSSAEDEIVSTSAPTFDPTTEPTSISKVPTFSPTAEPTLDGDHCMDIASSAECLQYDEDWHMCSMPDNWWYSQCSCTCRQRQAQAQCVDLDPTCKEHQANWNVCSVGGSWWQKQCKQTCGLCE